MHGHSAAQVQERLASRSRPSPGCEHGEDKKFEDWAVDVLPSLLYPHLDLAAAQARTVSGAHIRDLIFHSDAKTPFLDDLGNCTAPARSPARSRTSTRGDPARQPALPLPRPRRHRQFGILVARKPPRASVQRKMIDLQSSKRAAIICLDDSDLNLWSLSSNRNGPQSNPSQEVRRVHPPPAQ